MPRTNTSDRIAAVLAGFIGIIVLVILTLDVYSDKPIAGWLYALVSVWLASQAAKNVFDTIWLRQYTVGQELTTGNAEGFDKRTALALIESLIYLILLIGWPWSYLKHNDKALAIVGWSSFVLLVVAVVVGSAFLIIKKSAYNFEAETPTKNQQA